MMDKNFLKKQEQILKKQKENLESELSAVAKKRKTKGVKYIPKFLDLGQKEDETAQEVATYEEFLVLEKNLEKTLKDVNRALTKIKKGRFGLCEACKKPIEQKRLEAMPTAELCLSCANNPKRSLRQRLMFWRK